MHGRFVVEAFATGLWLGLTQVALGFAIMAGAGASAVFFFTLIAVWLAGGAAGILWAKPAWATPLCALAIALFCLARLALAARPFGAGSLGVGLMAGLAAGVYAGAFFRDRSVAAGEVRRLLLHENNGFVSGYAAAAVLLLVAPRALDVIGPALGVGLLLVRLGRGGVRALGLGPLLAVGSAALYLLVPYVGDRQWDALMTASVLARPQAVSTREVLFFAHPLVIPLTVPFFWLSDDPLQAAATREACFGAIVIGLAYLGARSSSRSRAAGFLAALALTLALSRWRLASSGEEKEVALAFGGGFVLLYLDHRGLLDLGWRWWRRVRIGPRRLVLGALLAAAVAVHLVNGLLVLVVAADVLIERKAWREAAVVLATCAGLASPFFLWLAIGPGGARSARAVTAYYLEYHLSGEFASLPTSVPERLVRAYLGGRAWLVGERACPTPLLEMVLASGLAIVLCVRALRVARRAAALLLVWIGLCAAHFFFYEPWDPEAWGPAALAWALVGAIGAAGPGRLRRARITAAGCCLLALAVLDVQAHVSARRDAGAAKSFAEGRPPRPAPLADVARWVDRQLERDAILVVTDRFLASYFHIYTDRDPIVLGFLDRTPAELYRDHHLTTLSLRFYTPALGSSGLRAAAQAGRPVYLLTAEPEPETEAFDLGWEGLHLRRFAP
jgi:hypothetical protein